MISTIGSIYLRQLAEGVIKNGGDIDGVLARADIPTALFYEGNSRVSSGQVARFMRALWKVSGDEMLAFMDQPCRQGTFGLITRLVSRASTLEVAFNEHIHFMNVIRGDFRTRLQVNGDECRFLVDGTVKQGLSSHIIELLWMVMWHRMSSWMIGKRIILKGAGFKGDYSQASSDNRILLPCDNVYNEAHNYICFDREYLDAPIIRSEAEFKRYVEKAPFSYFDVNVSDDSTISKVKKLLEDKIAIDETPDVETVAEELNISKQTLHRYLSKDGTNFQKIKDEMRRDIAIDKLINTGISVSDLSHQLGFSEPSSFTRAFKHWTGLAPAIYRKHSSE